jgi:hypothetical protein
MKKLKAVAISDLHLGEPEGMLYYIHEDPESNLIKATVKKIIELSKGDSNFEDGVEELILIGDIIELSEATPSEAYKNAQDFFDKLLEKVNVEKIIYIPGNHDHHFWVELLEKDCGEKRYEKCRSVYYRIFIKLIYWLIRKKTEKKNRPKTCITIKDPPLFIERCLKDNYPKISIEVHYPYYTLETKDSFYFFDHGHLFSKTLERTCWTKKVKDLETLEEYTCWFMEKIWYRGKNPLKVAWFKLREKLYDWWRKNKYKLKKPLKAIWLKLRKSLFVWQREKKYKWKKAKRGTRFKEDCAPVYDDYIRDKILWYLKEVCKIQEKYEDALSKDFHFVFGHTHRGGRSLKADRKFRFKGKFITVWNTGGWLVPSQVFSPDTYIFYIKNIENKGDKGMITDSYKLASKKYTTWEGDYYRKILYEVFNRIGKEDLVKEDMEKCQQSQN